MRVISGTARGLKLESLDGLSTRPTLDRVKESIFNMLFDKTIDSYVLDLFAGSGAMGIEALSRMSSHCTFVDCEQKAINIVKNNISRARFEQKSTVINSDFEKFLTTTTDKYDIVFVDPPYDAGFVPRVLDIIYERCLLNDDAIVVVETSKNVNPCISNNYNVIKHKSYGKVDVYLLEAIWIK